MAGREGGGRPKRDPASPPGPCAGLRCCQPSVFLLPTRLRWPRSLDLCPSALFCLYSGSSESPPPMLVRNGSRLADTHLPNGPMGLALLREEEMRMLITFSLAMVALLAGHASRQGCPRRTATRAGLTSSINQSDVAGACNIRHGYKRQLQHKSQPYPSTSY